MLNSQDQTIQLNINTPLLKNLSKNFLAEISGFRYQITLQITYCKEIKSREIKYSAPVYFNSNTPTINKY